MANEKWVIEATADCFEEVTKIKTHFAKIIAEGSAEKPYYSILYYNPTKKEYCIGYSSYDIANVFNWLSEWFEIVDAPQVDAVEVVHGRWVSDKADILFHCSVCETQISTDWDYDDLIWNYCPNCGAKMDK